MTDKLEKMDSFFAKRVDGYDEHMLRDVEGCKNGYETIAREVGLLAPESLLDLGCGTGLELDAIFRRLPGLRVTGIDMTAEMLEKLREKNPDKALTLINGDYFEEPFGYDYGAAVAFETLHHFTPERKLTLYRKIFASLKHGGVFLNGDYMCETDEQQEFFRAEYERLADGKPDGHFHYDTPLAVKNEIALLKEAGFREVREIFREGNTVILRALKS